MKNTPDEIEIFQQINAKQDKDAMLRRALERIIQLYTDKTHFVYELLQNAEDAKARTIKFIQYDDRLEVLHDGQPFSISNLESLRDIGLSDKVNDVNQIGEFGVGFKSVFGICEEVKLYSNPSAYNGRAQADCPLFAQKISDFINYEKIDNEPIEQGFTTKFVFPYAVGFSFSGFKTITELTKKISTKLKQLSSTTLLFMKNLQSIEYEICLDRETSKGCYVLDKQKINDHSWLIKSLGDDSGKEEDSSYLVFSRPVDVFRAARSVDIAFPLIVEEDGSWEFQSTKNPYISVYFPTETESKLDFIVQGPYRTTPNRSSIDETDPENIELANETAYLLKDSILELKKLGKLNLSFLKILPIEKTRFYNYWSNNSLFYPLYEIVEDLLLNEAVLPARNGKYIEAQQAKLVRGKWLTEIFSDDLLTELINDGIAHYWLPETLTKDNKAYEKLFDYYTSTLKIELISPVVLRKYFNKNKGFLKARNDEWLISLYNAFGKEREASFNRNETTNMLTAEFIKTSSGDFVAPCRKGSREEKYVDNIFSPVEFSIEGINIVDAMIYAQCRHFFDEILRLKKPNEYEYWITDFKKRCEQGYSADDEQHISDIKKILKYLNSLEFSEDLKQVLQNSLKLRCKKGDSLTWCNPFKENCYFAKTKTGIDIKGYYENVAEKCYIDDDFYLAQNIDLLKFFELNIKDSILIGENDTKGEYSTGKPGRQPEWHTYDNFKWYLSIDCIEKVLLYISKNPYKQDSLIKSQTIFKLLQQNEDMLMGIVYIGGNTQNINPAYSKIIGVLLNNHWRKGDSWYYYESLKEWDKKWLYTETGQWVSSTEISKHDLNKSIYGPIKYDSHLYEYLRFRKNEIDQHEEIIKEYDTLPQDKRDAYFERELERRYGISVKELNNVFLQDENDVNFPITFEFPTGKVKNWALLKKHVAEIFSFAIPVKYEKVLRQIRITKKSANAKVYLKGIYRDSNTGKYACQMCHKGFDDVEMCQIERKPEMELDPMHVCLCPNCASKFKGYRNNEQIYNRFFDPIKVLSPDTIMHSENSDGIVKIYLGDEEIWFSPVHIAEVTELLSIQNEAKRLQKEQEESDIKNSVGRNVRHKAHGMGTIIKITQNGNNISATIRFFEGAKKGEEVTIDINSCIKNGFIELIDC